MPLAKETSASGMERILQNFKDMQEALDREVHNIQALQLLNLRLESEKAGLLQEKKEHHEEMARVLKESGRLSVEFQEAKHAYEAQCRISQRLFEMNMQLSEEKGHETVHLRDTLTRITLEKEHVDAKLKGLQSEVERLKEQLRPAFDEDLSGGLSVGQEFTREMRRAVHRIIDTAKGEFSARNEDVSEGKCQVKAMLIATTGFEPENSSTPSHLPNTKRSSFQLTCKPRCKTDNNRVVTPRDFSDMQRRTMATLEALFGRSKVEAHEWKWDCELEDWIPVVPLRGYPPPPKVLIIGASVSNEANVTREDLWSEYSVGFGDQISLRELDRFWGKRWYQSRGIGKAFSDWYARYADELSRRRKLAHLIEELCGSLGWTPPEALGFLDEEFPVSGTAPALRGFLDYLMTINGCFEIKRKAEEYTYRRRALALA
ncbi:hypothetical protein Moror_12092 [Moniliophthora roreri MCA 2997]|nr:hypothetical protein Moror_12092 [Moniliophthora roreri MCA 2997]